MSKKPRKTADATDGELEDDLDALFRAPLAEFTGARNTLAALLKKSGRGDDAALVKALAKPSVSAWAVNQLYWNHRKAFDQLISSGERFHKAQTSGKIAGMREALDARRQGLSLLSDLATSLLRDAGHNPSLDAIRSIIATLEALSVNASRSDGPRPGRLTHDVDPPGFESLGSFVPAAGMKKKPPPSKVPQKSSSAVTNPPRKSVVDHNTLQIAEKRKTKIAAAKVSHQDAKKAERRKRDAEKNLEMQCSECGEDLAYQESDPCDRCTAKQSG